MAEPFLIYLNQLKDGAVQKFDISLPSDFLNISEPELAFPDPVSIKGEAYLAEEDLILHFDASTSGRMPCAACNQMTPFPLAVKGFYHTESLAEVSDLTFDFRPAVRDALLVDLPQIAECKGKCPERAALAKFLKKETAKDETTAHFPFANLKLPS